ncbi:hypothetical protein AGMMS50229_06490 [Campylobacterota bacterium]|nr:hypothetical protein AGMMS50229_06490 [Campylobacterota bacterium]
MRGKISLAAIAAAISLLLPPNATAAGNYGVELSNGYWQLIGVAGLFGLAGEGGGAQNPDYTSICTTAAVIDIADDWNNMSWDANTSTSELNAIAAVGDNDHYASTGNIPYPAGGINNPSTGQNVAQVGLGLPYHSVLGVRAIKVGAGSSLKKALVVIGRGITNPDGTLLKCIGKEYTAPMRTMYIVSPYSKGAPDVMISYQALYEGETFKISFKNDVQATWGDASTDRIYAGKLSHTRTYDNAVKPSELTLLDGTTSAPTDAGKLVNVVCPNGVITGGTCAFDMNITSYFVDPFTNRVGYEGNRTVLDGNLTMYRYDTSIPNGIWEVLTFEGNGDEENPTATGNRNTLVGGYGYWVRLLANQSALYATGVPGGNAAGFLVADDISGNSAYYEDKLAPGWNLLAFDDSKLRYTTSGFYVPDGEYEVVSPHGEVSITLDSTTADDCLAFNNAVTNYNAEINVNHLDVLCIAGAGGAYLISDKPFYIKGEGVTDGITAGTLSSLSNVSFKDTELIDINGSGTLDGLISRLGEYAVVVETNPAFLGKGLGAGISVGVPMWKSKLTMAAADLTNAADTLGVVTASGTAIPSFLTANGASAAVVVPLDLNNSTTTSGTPNAILIAADVRFFVRDNTFIRVFDVSTDYAGEHNKTIIDVVYNGVAHLIPESAIEWNGTYPHLSFRNAPTANANGVVGDVNFSKISEANISIIASSFKRLDYDVKEINPPYQLLRDVLPGEQKDPSDVVYGPFTKAYQASNLARFSSDANGVKLSPSISNLTYTPFWAEDFPDNGPIYYMTENNFTPQMILTAETDWAGTLISGGAPGTISWKALDLTRDPAEWFLPANGFELFWAEKERGYWVYLAENFANSVSVGAPDITASSVVIKHFNALVEGTTDEYEVFNWFSGYITAKVGGLIRPSYTSGQSYNVYAMVGDQKVPLSPTGTVNAFSQSDFTAYISDYEVSSVRPTGVIEIDVTATDGLGGKDTTIGVATLEFPYVKPATPELKFDGNSLTVTSDPNAEFVLIFEGKQKDSDHHTVAQVEFEDNGTKEIDLSSLPGISYPAAVIPVDWNGTIPDENAALGTIIKEWLIGASTGPADNYAGPGKYSSGASVYSNLRVQKYLPVYSGTAFLRIAPSLGEIDAVNPIKLNSAPAGFDLTRDYGVQLRADDVNSTGTLKVQQNYITTVVFQPRDVNLSDAAPFHANLFIDDSGTEQFIGELAWIRAAYQGDVFYVFVVQDAVGAVGEWFYGTFPGDAGGGKVWADNGSNINNGTNYKLKLQKVTTSQQLVIP